MTGYVGPIENLALADTCFRQVLFTAKHVQVVVMCLKPSEEIGDEGHANVDQFFRSELIETLDLKSAVLIGFSAGGREVARYVGRHGTRRVARAALIVCGDDDQIVPIGGSALVPSKLVPNPTLKIHAGAPHGLAYTPKDRLNADLLAFLKEGGLT